MKCCLIKNENVNIHFYTLIKKCFLVFLPDGLFKKRSQYSKPLGDLTFIGDIFGHFLAKLALEEMHQSQKLD